MAPGWDQLSLVEVKLLSVLMLLDAGPVALISGNQSDSEGGI